MFCPSVGFCCSSGLKTINNMSSPAQVWQLFESGMISGLGKSILLPNKWTLGSMDVFLLMLDDIRLFGLEPKTLNPLT